jgi:HlyD family secretion protein
MKRLINLTPLLLCGFLLGACQPATSDRTSPQPSQIKATGELMAANSIQVTPPAVQDLWQYNVKQMAPESSLLQEGDLVVQFDDQALQSTLNNKRAELENARQELQNQQQKDQQKLEELKLQLAERQMDFDRTKRKADIVDQATSANNRRKAQLDFTLAVNQLALANSRLEAHQQQRQARASILQAKIDRLTAEVSQTELDISRMQFKAPFTGMMLYQTNYEGEKYAVGDSVQFGTPLASISQLDTLYVHAVIDEIDLKQLKTGQKVQILLDAYPDKSFSGQLSSLGTSVRDKAYNDFSRVVDASISIDQADLSLMRPGQSVRLLIEPAGIASTVTKETP